MRTIRFKAKEAKSGKWVYGSYMQEYEYHYIVGKGKKDGVCKRFDVHKINLETLCEFTGILDGNGKEIYEHDLVDDFPHTMEVVFECGSFRLVKYDMQGDLIEEPSHANLSYYRQPKSEKSMLKVIGNKFDNEIKR